MKHFTMRNLLFVLMLISLSRLLSGQPVFKNPGIPASEYFEISDYLDDKIGFVTAKFTITLKERDGKKYYFIQVNEGNFFLNTIEANYFDLTTITEKRTDIRTNSLVESYINKGNGIIHFYNKENKIDDDFHNGDKNIYSRNAFFFYFRGFPFGIGNSVKFESYMSEYGNALTLKLTHVSIEKVTVKAGIFECNKLELSVAGWQSLFAPNKFYLYFSAERPYQFVKYAEKGKDGTWKSNELSMFIK
jgi:hypothetical protein